MFVSLFNILQFLLQTNKLLNSFTQFRVCNYQIVKLI